MLVAHHLPPCHTCACVSVFALCGAFVQWRHIREEVVSSERTYFFSLRDCVERYVTPISDACNTPDQILSRSQVFSLFGNLATVAAVSNFTLLHFAKCTASHTPVSQARPPRACERRVSLVLSPTACHLPGRSRTWLGPSCPCLRAFRRT